MTLKLIGNASSIVNSVLECHFDASLLPILGRND